MELRLIQFFFFIQIIGIYSSQTSTNHRVDFQRQSSNLKIKRISHNSTTNNRRKRFVIYEGGGVLKMVLGFSEPLDLLDKYPYRQIAVSYAFHLQYTPPPDPLYWWTYFVHNPSWSNSKGKQQKRSRKDAQRLKSNLNYSQHLNQYGTFVQKNYQHSGILEDTSRFAVYKGVEAVFNSKGLPGERCLLRSICEISQHPLEECNAISAIINAIFIPSVNNIEDKFLLAKRLGEHGVVCNRVFWSCNEGVEWLKKVLNYFYL